MIIPLQVPELSSQDIFWGTPHKTNFDELHQTDQWTIYIPRAIQLYLPLLFLPMGIPTDSEPLPPPRTRPGHALSFHAATHCSATRRVAAWWPPALEAMAALMSSIPDTKKHGKTMEKPWKFKGESWWSMVMDAWYTSPYWWFSWNFPRDTLWDLTWPTKGVMSNV